MANQSVFMKFGNFVTSAVLRSKMHSPMSGSTLLISFTGRVSGDLISTPVNYIRKDNLIYITSRKDRIWWRNLRGGAPVTLRYKGKDVEAWAEVRKTPPEVEKGIRLFNEVHDTYTRHYGLILNEDGTTNPARLKELAEDRVLVLVKLP